MGTQTIKLLALDIDGTVTNPDGSVSDQVVDAIRRIKSSGVLVAFVSARPPQGVDAIAQLIAQPVYRISYLGALIQDTAQKELRRLSLDIDVARDIAKFADSHNLSLTININDVEYHSQNQIRPSSTPTVCINCAESAFARGDPAVLIGANGNQAASLIYEYCVERHENSVYITRHFNSDNLLESTLIVHPKSYKGYALTTLCNILSINLDEVMSIGDSEGDISMFQITGCSVAVANATLDTRKNAKLVAPLSYGEGVVWAIDYCFQRI